MSNQLEIRKFNIREADWKVDGKQLSNIRRLVFIVEQQVPEQEEWDGQDEDSWHWIATDNQDLPIGTARLLPDGQIGRMAVLNEHRKFGVGAALLEQAVEKARHLGIDSVYLNAQSHALGFYERGGFTKEGEEFIEAGIPHFRMTQVLPPPEDNVQRQPAVAATLELDVKSFDTSEVNWREVARTIKRIRRQVLAEQSKDYIDEDNDDLNAIHWIATNQDGHTVGVIRMTADGHLSQFAVVDEYRRRGIGTSLLELAKQRARRNALKQLQIIADAAADTPATRFLNQVGYVSEDGNLFVLTIEPENTNLMRRAEPGESFGDDVTYRLGKDKQLILLRRESDFRNIIIEMAGQAAQNIRIYSRVLSHNLYDQPELNAICSQLARRNKYTKIEILVFDAHRMIKNGHALLDIARKLPSSIGIKVVDPEMRQQNLEYMLADGQGVIYRPEADKFEGTACFFNITECNRLTRHFAANWESGIIDPNLRQLRI
jgi:predicted GNAT family N-acyltransferase